MVIRRLSIERFTRPVGTLALLVGAWLIGGCGQEASTPASKPTSEVRGEPIRGEPIAPPPTAPAPREVATQPAPAAPTPAAPPAAVPATPATPTEVASAASSAAQPPATPVAPTAVTPVTDTAAGGGGTPDNPLSVTFDKLASFSYSLPEGPVDTNTVAQTNAPEQIPTTIKDLNNRFISLKGFMLPLKVEKGLVTELLIMRDQSMCCYGTVPRINEWVSVKMVGQGVKPIMDQAVTLFGKFKVGEMYENGYLVGIYALDGERMAGPLDM